MNECNQLPAWGAHSVPGLVLKAGNADSRGQVFLPSYTPRLVGRQKYKVRISMMPWDGAVQERHLPCLCEGLGFGVGWGGFVLRSDLYTDA